MLRTTSCRKTTTDELYFADFYFRPEIPWRPKEAKDLKEANHIYQHYRGQEVRFGDLKEWIIMETPYQFHSRALRLLEWRILLVIVSTNYQIKYLCPKYKRKNMVFPRHVGTYRDDPDWGNRLMIKYCNNWLLKFEEETQENTKSVKKKRKREHETPTQNSWGNFDAVKFGETKRKLF